MNTLVSWLLNRNPTNEHRICRLVVFFNVIRSVIERALSALCTCHKSTQASYYGKLYLSHMVIDKLCADMHLESSSQ